MILSSVPVQVLNNVGDLNGEVFLDPEVVLIAHFSLYGVGGIGFVVKNGCCFEGAVSIDGE